MTTVSAMLVILFGGALVMCADLSMFVNRQSKQVNQ